MRQVINYICNFHGRACILKKHLIEKLKSLYKLNSNRNNNRKVIETHNLTHAEFLWHKVYYPQGWDIEKPIKVAWSWKLNNYCYRFVIKKNDI